MGAGASSNAAVPVDELKALSMTTPYSVRELRQLQTRFCKSAREVAIDAYLSLPSVGAMPLLERILDNHTTPGAKTMPFKPFVTMLGKLSSRGKTEEKLKLVFEVADRNGDGFVEAADIGELSVLLLGEGVLPADFVREQVAQGLQAQLDPDARLGFPEFTQLVSAAELVDRVTIDFV